VEAWRKRSNGSTIDGDKQVALVFKMYFAKSDITTTNILTITIPDGGLGRYNTVDNSVSRKCIAGGDTIVAGKFNNLF
jgi:hypothetical protein